MEARCFVYEIVKVEVKTQAGHSHNERVITNGKEARDG